MGSTVLIADDSALTRTLLRAVLEGDHEIVAEAENGVEAVERYEEIRPDVVIVDVDMPIQDGLEATAAIKAADSDASVLTCTGVHEEERTREALRAGGDGHITKPFQKQGVLRAVADAAQSSP